MYHINCGKESGRNTDAATAEYPDNVLFWRPGENGRFYVTDTDFFIFIGGSTMRNKKGFTLVELVIVIAVIAILAGVMIGTFASVVKKAKESAKMQEMTAQKQEQIANDIDQKLKNAEWLGWTDFEEKLAEALTETMNKATVKLDEGKVKEATNDAVEKAFAKYASSLGSTNTGLTAEQVKYIVETALSNKSYSGVTAEQVKAIVNNATSGLSNLSKSQVQAIVDAAQAKNLTLAQVTAAITNAVKDINEKAIKAEDIDAKFAEVEKNLTDSIKDLKDATLKESDIEKLLAKYITNGEAKGDYTWYNANATTMEVTSADQLVALSTLSKGGTSFKGKTIELPAEVDLTKTDFQPIMDFDGTLKGATKTENDKTVPATTVKVNVTPVWNTLDGRNGDTMMNYFGCSAGSDRRKDAVAYGLVASLEKGGVDENIKVVLDVNMADPGNRYTYFGGIVGFLNGGTIRNCEVSGSIKGYNRIGGVVGYALYGTIQNVKVDVAITSKKSVETGEASGYNSVGGVVGYASLKGLGEINVLGCEVTTKDSNSNSKFNSDYATEIGSLFGQIEFKGITEFNDAKGYFANVIGCKVDGKDVTDSVTNASTLGIRGDTNNQSIKDGDVTLLKISEK